MPAHPIGHDACTGTLRHAPDQGIIGIEGCPFRWQSFHKLAFLESRSLASPECGVVVVANRRPMPIPRAQQPKRLRQGSWAPRSDLTNTEPHLRTHLLKHVAKSAWNPSRAVLAGTGPFQNCRCQGPCGCLAATAGDGDEGDVIEPARRRLTASLRDRFLLRRLGFNRDGRALRRDSKAWRKEPIPGSRLNERQSPPARGRRPHSRRVPAFERDDPVGSLDHLQMLRNP